ncbi:MAG TPA: DUF177 domain-containing protein [Xanthobacteraceae bacterium]|jgi:uncharacterized metal-binding protein YceD (DUF177 family)|nr:DUF177 domain-containing protein [Xanthobacteraceae bacterium]
MPEHKTENAAATPWHVPIAVDDVDEAGRHFELAADAAMRAEVAQLAGVRDLPRFEASFDVNRRGNGGLHVAGTVSATVGQNCVVTLEPLLNDISETVDLVFLPQQPAAEPDGEGVGAEAKWNDPEPLIGGVIDLGAMAIEFLLLGIDPYPRKPGAVFEPPPGPKPDGGPFAALGPALGPILGKLAKD